MTNSSRLSRNVLEQSLLRRRDRIFLTGFMGSGKSTIGPILANTIGYDFVDLDRLVESHHGKSVNLIFLEDGQEVFRETEKRLLSELSLRSRIVVSLGGGTILDEENFRNVHDVGIIIYLRSKPEELFKRLRNKTDRPVLKDPQGERLEEELLKKRILSLHATRDPIYSQSDIVIDTDTKRVGLTVDEVSTRLSAIIR